MSEFIKMQKDGAVIEVHPLAVADHQSLGWMVVEQPVEPEAAPAEEPKKAEGKKSKKTE